MIKLVVLPPQFVCPILIAAAGERAQIRFLEFFASKGYDNVSFIFMPKAIVSNWAVCLMRTQNCFGSCFHCICFSCAIKFPE